MTPHTSQELKEIFKKEVADWILQDPLSNGQNSIDWSAEWWLAHRDSEYSELVEKGKKLKKRTDLKDTIGRTLPNAKIHGFNDGVEAILSLINEVLTKK